MKRKLIACCGFVAMAFSLVACGQDDTGSSKNKYSAKEASPKVEQVTTTATTARATAPREDYELIPEEEPEDIPSLEELEQGMLEVPSDSDEPLVQGDHVVNILLIGQDRRDGEQTQRSDSMILVTFNNSTGKIALTSFMRDQYVAIPGYGNDKLCHAYAYGGMPLLNQTLYDNFGVEVDGNVEVDFSGFTTIVDSLGGVEIALTEKEASYLNKQGNWSLSEGLQMLDGQQALEYSRIRYIDNDYKRAERQRKLLLAMAEGCEDISLLTMLKMVEEFLPLVTTDIPQEQIMSYAIDLFPMMADAPIETWRIPVDGTFSEGYVRISDNNRMWCQYDIDFQANRQILKEIFDTN